MIYTLTLSPAIDYNMYIDNVRLHEINKSNIETMHAGGKGINVSIVLKNLGIDSICLGFLGGFTGRFIKDFLDNYGIGNDFVWIKQDTRINVKIKENDFETAIDGMGPIISVDEKKQLIDKILMLKKGDILIISGNKASGLDNRIYEEILDKLDKDVIVICDTVRELLMSVLKYKPFFIKPNLSELEELYNVKIDNKDDALKYGFLLHAEGAKNVFITLGENGAILITEDKKVYYQDVVNRKKVVNTIGAGDSFVAGVVYEYLKSKDLVKALKVGVTLGSATSYVDGLATYNDVKEYL